MVKEGENNEKLLFHPSNTQSMSSYRFVHNRIFYTLDLLASLLLLFLTVFEEPAVQGLQLDKSVSKGLVSSLFDKSRALPFRFTFQSNFFV